MAFQIVALAVIFAVATAAPQAGYESSPASYDQSVPKYNEPVKAVEIEYNVNPEYSFSYEVNDEKTGDVKSQHETRNGDVVEGSYSLIEADGTRRIVEYKADDHNGFNAVVHNEGVPQNNFVATPAVAVPQQQQQQQQQQLQSNNGAQNSYEYQH